MGDELDMKIAELASDKAYADWDRSHGFGLYHSPQSVIDAELDEAEKKIRAQVELVEETIRLSERKKIIRQLKSSDFYDQVEDKGLMGTDVIDLLIQELSRN